MDLQRLSEFIDPRFLRVKSIVSQSLNLYRGQILGVVAMAEFLSNVKLPPTTFETLLDGRYQIIDILSMGTSGSTYLAQDTHYPGDLKCLVKSYRAIAKLHLPSSPQQKLALEARALEQLSIHAQIPKLLAYFEENETAYLVREFVLGEPLRDLLPVSPRCDKRWSETQVVQLLQDILEILQLIHAQGFIHCNLTPDKIIRRAEDGKFILSDFSAIQPLHQRDRISGKPSATVAIGTFGYVAAEQLMNHFYPTTDIYALGLIGIQALSGLHPSQLQMNAQTGELEWFEKTEEIAEGVHHAIAQWSDDTPLTRILKQMVRYYSQDRYQSATEVLRSLISFNPPGVNVPFTITVESEVVNANLQDGNEIIGTEIATAREESTDHLEPTLSGIFTDLETMSEAENTLTDTVEIESKKESAMIETELRVSEVEGEEESSTREPDPIISEVETAALESTEEISIVAPDSITSETEFVENLVDNKGEIAISKPIRLKPSPLMVGVGVVLATNALTITAGAYSLLYLSGSNSGTGILMRATDHYQAGKFSEAIALVQTIPKTNDAYQQAQAAMAQWQQEWQIASTHFDQLETAFKDKQWSAVLQSAKNIPEVDFWQKKAAPLVEKAQAQQEADANELLQHAYDLAREKEFVAAANLLKEIPSESSIYQTAQAKISEYNEKHHLKQEAEAYQLLRKAFEQAQAKEFTAAIQFLEKIPENTSVYAQAQQKQIEYTTKQRVKAYRLLELAEEHAIAQDYTKAIDLLQQITNQTSAYEHAQTRLARYKEQLRRLEALKTQPNSREDHSAAVSDGETLQQPESSEETSPTNSSEPTNQGYRPNLASSWQFSINSRGLNPGDTFYSIDLQPVVFS